MQVALLCVQENPVDRPSMLEVSSMLKNETGAITNPKRPAFSIQRDENEEQKCQLQENMCSVDEATISQVIPRWYYWPLWKYSKYETKCMAIIILTWPC